MKNFKRVSSDMDCQVMEKTINCVRLTRRRMKLILAYCRTHTKRWGNCGHEWDCCGCVSSTSMEIEYNYPFIILTYTVQFNY